MFRLIRSLTVRQGLAEQLPALVGALCLAEAFSGLSQVPGAIMPPEVPSFPGFAPSHATEPHWRK